MFKSPAFLHVPLFLKRIHTISNYSNSISCVFQNGKIGDKINIKGWVKSLRKQKENTFLDLNDGSTEKKLQIIVPSNLFKDTITTGASLNVSGDLTSSPKGQLEVHASNIEVYGQCIISDGYPFAPRKQYSPEYIRQYLHFRPRTQKFSSLLRVRSEVISAINTFFKSENYIQIHTPVITANDCEGAGEVFKILPDSNELLKSMVKEGISLEDSFFNTKTFLTVSGQLHLEAAAHGLSRVYSLGPIFRAENTRSRLHLSEFYMLEVETAFLDDLEELILSVEKLLKSITNDVLNSCENDIKICHPETDSTKIWLDKKFSILTYEEAIEYLKSKGEDLDLVSGFTKEQELLLVNHLGGIPVFLINWPKSMKPFYMKECTNDNTKVSAFDLLVPNVGELVGGSLRENSYEKLKKGIPDDDKLDWYMSLRKYGSVPTGGYGLGFERYLMFLLGIENIKDVIPFPRWPHNCNL